MLKIKRHATVYIPSLGRLPIEDSKFTVKYVMDAESARDGKKNNPPACAVSLANRKNAALFGKFIASYVYKTFTLIVVLRNQKQRVLRFSHANSLRRSIDGFDKAKITSLKAVDTVTLHAPKGYMRLGHSNSGGTGTRPVLRPRAPGTCMKRGVYMSPILAQRAIEELRGTGVKVLL